MGPHKYYEKWNDSNETEKATALCVHYEHFENQTDVVVPGVLNMGRGYCKSLTPSVRVWANYTGM